jgi:hypothetical protein
MTFATRLATDARTLVALLRGDLTAADALTRGSAELEGDRPTLDRFVEMFAYPAVDPELLPTPAN